MLNFFVSFCLILFLNNVSADPCANVDAFTPVTMQQALSCMQTVKSVAGEVEDLITFLNKTMQSYAFLDVLRSPPANIIKPVDFLRELTKIGESANNNVGAPEFDFWNRVSLLFASAHDAHLNYSPNWCFGQFKFVQPIPFFAHKDSNGNAVLATASPRSVASSLLQRNLYYETIVEDFEQTYGSGVDSFLDGAQVLKINGRDPFGFVKKFANRFIGVSKFEQVRMQLALTTWLSTETVMGKLNYVAVSQSMPMPDLSYSNFTVTVRGKNGQQRTFSSGFKAVISRTLLDSDDFFTLCYSTAKKRSSTVKIPARVEIEPDYITQRLESQKLISNIASPYSPSGWRWLSRASDINLFVNTKQTALALHISSFAVSDPFDFHHTIEHAFDVARRSKMTDLVIDLSLNGGGSLCYAFALLNYTGLANKEHIGFYTVNAESQLTQAMARAGSGRDDTTYSSGSYRDSVTKQVYTDDSWFFPLKERVEQQHRRVESQRVFTFADCPSTAFNATANQLYTWPNIHIVSRGHCGSTCAIFMDYAAQSPQARTVGIAQSDKSDAVLSSFAGGNVVACKEFLNEIELLKKPKANASKESILGAKQLATGAFVPQPSSHCPNCCRLPVTQIYSRNPDLTPELPLEFQVVAPDVAIFLNQSEAMNFGSYWERVIAL